MARYKENNKKPKFIRKYLRGCATIVKETKEIQQERMLQPA
jgi:hypothetical protein